MSAEEKSGHVKNVRFKNITEQKKCPQGNVIFKSSDKKKKKSLPFDLFLTNYKKMNSLGCENDTFPTYKNGKYCCEKIQHTEQEALDYINNLIINALETILEEMFYKFKNELNYLINKRYELIYYNPTFNDLLIDYLKTPETLNLLDESDSFKKSINNLAIIGDRYLKLPPETIQILGNFYRPNDELVERERGSDKDILRLDEISEDYDIKTTDARDEIVKLELKITEKKKIISQLVNYSQKINIATTEHKDLLNRIKTLKNETKILQEELNKKNILHKKRLKLLNAAEKRRTRNIRGGNLIKNKKKKAKTLKRKRNKTKKR